MLVTFHSRAWGDITMFGDIAVELLRMMGHTGTVPSALRAKDIAPALDQLQHKLGVTVPPGRVNEDEDSEPNVDLRKRAFPLIQMLRASAREGADVLWEEGQH
jgi:hypothetical protein